MKHSSEYSDQDLAAIFNQMATANPIPKSSMTCSIAYKFQQDFGIALRHILQNNDSYLASGQSLNIHILRGDLNLPGHGLGEAAILEHPKTGAYVVLIGERARGDLSFNRGIRGFRIIGDNPLKEVSDLFRSWDKFHEKLKVQYPGHFARQDILRELFKWTKYEDAAEKYLDPILSPARGGPLIASKVPGNRGPTG